MRPPGSADGPGTLVGVIRGGEGKCSGIPPLVKMQCHTLYRGSLRPMDVVAVPIDAAAARAYEGADGADGNEA